jgi:putative phosphoribosyl transferase
MFANRAEAGRRLATSLERLKGPDIIVLGLPRGGVPVAYEVAKALGAPLDVIVVRKLGVPFQRELAMGAVGEGGVIVLNHDVVRAAHISEGELASAELNESLVVGERAQRFRAGRPRLSLEGMTALLVDDGIATGATARAACLTARAMGAERIVLAAPVGPIGVEKRFAGAADEVICPEQPPGFQAVGEVYRDFGQTSDDEVATLLRRRADELRPASTTTPAAEDVAIALPEVTLAGRLSVPVRATGVVVFVHGSGSSRHSPRNRYVASVLNEAGLATLLFDLLTGEEEKDRRTVFDVGLLADRLRGAVTWLSGQPGVGSLPLGLLGASTGAAAALWAAGDPELGVKAVVSRGGRPDLAEARLGEVTVPTLLVVGGWDNVVLELNQKAQGHLRCTNRLAVVPGATHLFEEPGTLSEAAHLARDWFLEYLTAPA